MLKKEDAEKVSKDTLDVEGDILINADKLDRILAENSYLKKYKDLTPEQKKLRKLKLMRKILVCTGCALIGAGTATGITVGIQSCSQNSFNGFYDMLNGSVSDHPLVDPLSGSDAVWQTTATTKEAKQTDLLKKYISYSRKNTDYFKQDLANALSSYLKTTKNDLGISGCIMLKVSDAYINDIPTSEKWDQTTTTFNAVIEYEIKDLSTQDLAILEKYGLTTTISGKIIINSGYLQVKPADASITDPTWQNMIMYYWIGEAIDTTLKDLATTVYSQANGQVKIRYINDIGQEETSTVERKLTDQSLSYSIEDFEKSKEQVWLKLLSDPILCLILYGRPDKWDDTVKSFTLQNVTFTGQ